MEKSSGKRSMVLPVCVVLVIMYVVTFLLLLLLAYVMYKNVLPEKMVGPLIDVIYVIAGFIGGLFCGKLAGRRRLLWGLFMGLLYFAVLCVTGYVMGGGISDNWIQILTALLLCVFSSAAGGMVS